ncbi:MAG: GxxExxY protein [Prevotella sp.]|nr:GxxExxY protein [Prevotella sp.]
MVDDKIILELKAVARLVPAHSAQLINYLTITQHQVGLLLNFGEGRDYKRVCLKV